MGNQELEEISVDELSHGGFISVGKPEIFRLDWRYRVFSTPFPFDPSRVSVPEGSQRYLVGKEMRFKGKYFGDPQSAYVAVQFFRRI